MVALDGVGVNPNPSGTCAKAQAGRLAKRNNVGFRRTFMMM